MQPTLISDGLTADAAAQSSSPRQSSTSPSARVDTDRAGYQHAPEHSIDGPDDVTVHEQDIVASAAPNAGQSQQESAAEISGDAEKLPARHSNNLQDQTNYLPVRQILIVFAAMQLAVLLSFLDQSMLSSALPTISAHFGAGRSSSWVASAYLLTTTAFQPILGRFSDIFGRKLTLQGCILVFTIGSVACGVAQTMKQLIFFRALAGVGGGGLITLVFIIVSDIVSLKDRGKYQGITEMTIILANCAGPIIGGVFAQKLSWRWIFWLTVIIAPIGIVIVQIFLPLKAVKGSMRTKLAQIDYVGSLLTIGACTLILLPLNWGGVTFSWNSPRVLGCLIGGFVCFVVFMLYEWKVPKIPVIPMYIFKIRTAASVFASTTISGGTLMAQVFYVVRLASSVLSWHPRVLIPSHVQPQFLQIVRGVSPIRSGVLFIPLLMMVTLMVFCTGQGIARTGEYKIFIVCGYAIWSIGLGLLSTLNESSSTAKLVGFLIITGFGQGQTLQSSLVAVQAAVQRADMSVATSTRNFLRAFGGTLSLAIASTIINNTLKHTLLPEGFEGNLVGKIIDSPTEIWQATTVDGQTLFALPAQQKVEIIAAYVKGFRVVFIVFASLQAFNFVITMIFMERLNLVRKDEEALKERGTQMLQERKRKKRAKRGGVDLEKGGEEEAKSHTSSVEHSTVDHSKN
ncbi:BZ3500_MvSof-1268-A1-R1_Chr6-2g08512 [Microbotryum saponariae]|uniref:BZ3500_MvSof-1268-A1-R1_Chr6-2g08512 protein n=1 Tax=Microbotryum saponariae TaxID=289078 RepID=A0A2X0LPA6_9BASI|nr:BZ3500_MvSof-1268-A1-R1_Chr6-2g08512 [Microbotryum saponariae]SDA07789.1 BZ3501_MvSof-1269-A2-R1_Chr6-1g08226 [Microbotryum saponariae]